MADSRTDGQTVTGGNPTAPASSMTAMAETLPASSLGRGKPADGEGPHVSATPSYDELAAAFLEILDRTYRWDQVQRYTGAGVKRCREILGMKKALQQ